MQGISTTTAAMVAEPRLNGAPSSPLAVSREDVAAFLAALELDGRSATTLSCYATKLSALLDYLKGSPVMPGTLAAWRGHLLEAGYSPRTVNTYVSAANGLVGFLGRRDLQLVGQLDAEGGERASLTRAEYLSLLSTARDRGRQRDYLLAKTIATLGVSASSLDRVTVAAAACGRLLDGREDVVIPPALADELLSFARAQGMEEGPVFRGRDGRPLSRTAVAACLRSLARDAGLPPERCGPGALSQLRRTALEKIEESLAALVKKTYEGLIDAEQAAVGWSGPARRA